MVPAEIEEILKPCLWDADLKALDLKEDWFVIVERLLEHGGDRQIGLLSKTYERDKITEVLKQSLYLSPRTVNYWCLRLGLEREETQCFTRSFPRLWPPS
ncbi:MAG: hypothetical protein NT009_05270 [Proteobacteria bacterium]|nr:hypothetical protein [Pseudomonadota bacterium]